MLKPFERTVIPIILSSCPSAWAQTFSPLPGTDAAERAASSSGFSTLAAVPLGPRSSPFEPPEQNDTTFLVDGAPGELDTGCSFRSEGPLEFVIEIDRYVGPVDGDGRLRDADALIAAGVISPTARLIMPAFDIDPGGIFFGEEIPPEIDQVSLNGVFLGNLTGANNIWRLNEFTVDIRNLRFASRGAAGALPAGARNTIRIDIDQASGEFENWCTAIDWASLSFKAVSPVVLVHGNASNAGFWDRHGFSAAMEGAFLPFDGCGEATRCQNPINIPAAPIADNGARLAAIIPGIVRSFGADSFHIVAHSKGGLDSREFLARLPSDGEIELISHNTLSTPHNGSVLADIGQERDAALAITSNVRFRGFPAWTETVANRLESNPGNPNLRTSFAAQFNLNNLPNLPSANYNQVAADADRNGSGSINTEAEIAALRRDTNLPSQTFIATRAVNVLYQNLRRVSGVRVAVRDSFNPFSSERVVTLNAIPTTELLQNDVLVTVPSGLGVGSIAARSTGTRVFNGVEGRNHSDVADGNVATNTVIPWILEAARSRGDLR